MVQRAERQGYTVVVLLDWGGMLLFEGFGCSSHFRHAFVHIYTAGRSV